MHQKQSKLSTKLLLWSTSLLLASVIVFFVGLLLLKVFQPPSNEVFNHGEIDFAAAREDAASILAFHRVEQGEQKALLNRETDLPSRNEGFIHLNELLFNHYGELKSGIMIEGLPQGKALTIIRTEPYRLYHFFEQESPPQQTFDYLFTQNWDVADDAVFFGEVASGVYYHQPRASRMR